jgi:hypothetical protein
LKGAWSKLDNEALKFVILLTSKVIEQWRN